MNELEVSDQDFGGKYESLSDDQLLQLSSEGGLTDSAQVLFDAEMKRRSLGSKDVQSFEQWKKDNEPPPPPPKKTVLGYGIGYMGRTPDGSEFITTRFLILRGARVIPLGSYRATDGMNGFPKIGERVALQWGQVWLGLRTTVYAILIGLTLVALMIVMDKK